MPIASLDEIRSKVGDEIGVSDWLTVDQARIDAFAEATEASKRGDAPIARRQSHVA